MIERIITEIKQAIDNKLYIIALSSALTLPDVCGKAEYPKARQGERYKNWIKNYIEKKDFLKYMIPPIDIDAELIYKLRCSLLHQGTPNVEKNIADYFELVICPYNEGRTFLSMTESEYETVNGEEILVARRVSINIETLCRLLCACAWKYYHANPEKFSFINYNLTNIDFHTAKTFNIKPKRY